MAKGQKLRWLASPPCAAHDINQGLGFKGSIEVLVTSV